MSLRLNKAQRERLRAVASRLYREGDDHTMSGGFAVYSEGEAVEAACEDLEACLALLRETLEAFDDAAPDGHIDLPIVRIGALLASEVSR